MVQPKAGSLQTDLRLCVRDSKYLNTETNREDPGGANSQRAEPEIADMFCRGSSEIVGPRWSKRTCWTPQLALGQTTTSLGTGFVGSSMSSMKGSELAKPPAMSNIGKQELASTGH